MRQSLNKDHLYLKNCHGEDRVDFFSIISENRHKIGFNYEKADFDRSSVKISYLQQWESLPPEMVAILFLEVFQQRLEGHLLEML